MKLKAIIIGIMGLLVSSCNETKLVLEVTTFKTQPTTNASTFNKLDAEVENNFTNKQPGFISRQSGTNEKGEYVVLVYWDTHENAQASMQKFMTDKSVADYAAMIDASSMKMVRYDVDKKLEASNSSFIEVMSFQTKADTDIKVFNKTNKRVEKDFTAKQTGFLQRITGVNETGEQIVAVYWDNKSNSDAALQPFMDNTISKEFMGMMDQSTIKMGRYQTLNSVDNNKTELSKKDKVVALLNSFNTGDQTPISYINPNKYIQHNLGVADGLQGFGEVMQHAPPQGFKANIIRAFEDGDYVVTQTEYDFFGPKIGFDIFRFENGLIVEHWDNLTAITPANPSNHTQIDGTTEVKDLEKTKANKAIVSDFVNTVLIKGEFDKLSNYFERDNYIQHNSSIGDGLSGFGKAMEEMAKKGITMVFEKNHMILGEGNFVLTVTEGKFGGKATSYYDLFRVENGKIAEHWDVMETIAPKKEWKNENGKF